MTFNHCSLVTILLIPGRSITVKGIAWGGGGLGIARVDVSADGGEHFTRSASTNLTTSQSWTLISRAELLDKPIKEKRKSQWSWQFFERTVPLSDSVRERLLAGEPVDIVLTSKVC